MVLKKTKAKLAALYDTVKSKDGTTINASHVQQILDKIDRKERRILDALKTATDEAKREKLARKHAVIVEQRTRGEELLRLVRGDAG